MNNLVKKTAFTVGACILSVLPAIAQDAAGKQQQPAAPVAVAESQPKVLVRVTATTSARKYLAKHKADIVSADKRSIVVLTEQSAIGALKKAGLKVTETESFAAPSSTARTFQQQDRRYHDYMGTVASLRGIAMANPDVAAMFSIGKTIEGRDIIVLRINTQNDKMASSTKPGILFTAAMHGREHLGTEVAINLANWLVNNKNSQIIGPLLANRDIFIIPMVNPDGVEYDISDTAYKGWKKNTRKLLGGVGVDLNHNFPVFWGTPQNGLADIASDEYKGTAPFSEPETTALRNFITQSPNIRLAISYHTYGEQIFYPWFASASPVPNEQDATTLKLLASKAAALTGYAAMQGGAAAPNTGDFSDWLISTRRILPLEIVLSPNSKMPLKDAIAGFYPGSQMIDMATVPNLKAAHMFIAAAGDPAKFVRPQATETTVESK